MKKFLSIIAILIFTLSFQNVNAQKRYSGKTHKSSHGGSYKGGKGKSHKGGKYKNSKTNNKYGKHKK